MPLNKDKTIGLLRAIALVVTLAGAGSSVGFMLNGGSDNDSTLLIGLFICWVLSPFVALLVAFKFSKNWSVPFYVTLYCLMLFIAIVSVILYSGVLSPPESKGAFMFLAVPFVSWFLIGKALLLKLWLRKKSTV